jgi:hypothetical protein
MRLEKLAELNVFVQNFIMVKPFESYPDAANLGAQVLRLGSCTTRKDMSGNGKFTIGKRLLRGIISPTNLGEEPFVRFPIGTRTGISNYYVVTIAIRGFKNGKFIVLTRRVGTNSGKSGQRYG